MNNYNNTNSKDAESAENAVKEKSININNTEMPHSVYRDLPVNLAELVAPFDKNREKDIFLTGLLGVASGCIDKLYSIYMNAEVFSNLYMFVAAPAGSGKGKLSFLRNTFKDYHSHKKENNGQMGALFIPGNTTSAAIISQLKENDNKGVLFETEADALSVALKGEHGQFSYVLRNAFHHEVVSLARKSENQFDELNNLQLSVVLSGTPKQIPNLIPSSEDGLLSRFTFYYFQDKSEWNFLNYNGNVNLNEFFSEKGKEICKKFIEFSNKEDKVKFNLSDKQVKIFNEHFCRVTKRVNSGDDNLNDFVNRNALVTYRIAMILSFFRKVDEVMHLENLECQDIDFLNALRIGDIYLTHNLDVFRNLLPSRSNVSNKREDYFYSQLPEKFETVQAVEIGSSRLNIEKRAVLGRLDAFIGNGLLTRVKRGFYQKKMAS